MNETWLKWISALSVCIAIAVASGGLWSTQFNSPFNEHQLYVGKLQAMREAAYRLQRNVLLVTAGKLLSYDNLVEDLSELREREKKLLQFPSFLNSEQKSDLTASLHELDNLLTELDHNLSLFMQQNSILRNSLTYLNQSVHNPEAKRSEFPLIYETISYYNFPDDERKQQLIFRLNKGQADRSVAKHINIILERKVKIDEALAQLLGNRCEHEINSLFSSYLKKYEEATKPTETSRLWLYIVLVAILMCLAIYVVEQLAWSMKQVKLAETKYREIFEHAKEGIFRATLDLSDISINPALRTILEIKEEEETLTKLKKLAQMQANAATAKQITKTLQSDSEINDLELLIEQPEHPKPTWLILNARLRDKYIDGSVLDISARKEAEQLFEEFYSFISHELRTPLTSIAGSLSLMASGKIDPAKFPQLIQTSLNSSERLIRLVNDLLDMKKVQSGRFDLFKEEVLFSVLINSAIAAVSGLTSSKKIEFKITGNTNIQLCLDLDRITQVLINLLSNAIKYSPDSGEITISVDSQLVNGENRLVCSVGDQGPGIKPENVKLLFQRFSQIGNSVNNSQIKGSGLGLFISRSIVEEHGGEMNYSPNPQGGSLFWFNLPITLAEV